MPRDDEIFVAPAEGLAFDPAHPGEVLREELSARGLTANALALKLRVPANRLTEIVNGKRAISARDGVAPEPVPGPCPVFWLSLQSQYNLARAEQRFGAKIRAEVEAAE